MGAHEQVVRPDHRRFAAPWGGWRSASAVVFGLCGVAVTQPLLDLFGRNPEFFVVGRYGRAVIIVFALAVAVVPGLIGSGLVALARALGARAGAVVLDLVSAGLGAVFGNVLLRGLGGDGSGQAVVAALVGAVLALALLRWAPGRMLLELLALGNVLFLVGFALMSPTSELLLGGPDDGDLGRVVVPDVPGPVVVIVLDELPLTTLLTPDGSVNGQRFPAFAELADGSTWFRNASSHDSLTARSVPTLLTGRLPEEGALPTLRDHPRNLFSLLGPELPVARYELVTDLCPEEVCEPPPAQSIAQALSDAAVVYGHRVLPPSLRSDLPAIDHSWGAFGDDLGDGAAPAAVEADVGGEEVPTESEAVDRWAAIPAAERSAAGQAAILLERGRAITPDPSLHLIHVALPHYPWVLTPWGTRLMDYAVRVEDPADPAYDWTSRQQYQLQSMQTGAADAVLAQVLAHLKESGAWEQATVVVTSDHGVSLTPPDFGRHPTADNRQELYRVPLFIKAPGQTTGEVRDEPAQLIDVLPSLIDLLDVETDWELDGHSLYDGSPAGVEPEVGSSFEPALEVVRRHLAGSPGLDWVALAAVGEHADLVGTALDDLTVGPPSSLGWTPDHGDAFASLPTAEGRVPQLLTGVVHADRAGLPELAVAVNGTIAGVAGGYVPAEGGARFSAFLGPFLAPGANDIELFEVERGPGGAAVLHQLG